MRQLAPILGGSKVRIRRLGIGGLAAVLWVVLLGALALPALASGKRPTVILGSESVSAVTSTGATFAAQVNPNNEETTYGFEYATSETGLLKKEGAKVEELLVPLTGSSEQLVSLPTVAPLSPSTTYFYRAEATNATGTGYGTVQSFTTVPTPTTDAATAVTTGTATLNGHLGPLDEKVATQYHFVYNLGATCVGGSETPVQEAGKGSGTKVAVAGVGGLQPSIEYTACLVTSDESGGSDTAPGVHFTTLGLAPVVASEAASGVQETEATLEAQVNPENESTKYTFEYSTTEAAGSLTGTVVKVAGGAELSGFPEQLASVTLTGLTAGETYFYRVVAENAQSETEGKPVVFPVGSVQSFAAAPEAPKTEPATSPTAKTATFNGVLNPKATGELSTGYYFAYSPGATCVEVVPGSGETAHESEVKVAAGTKVSALAVGLQPHQKYKVCLVVFNAGGGQSAVGNQVEVETLAAPPKVDGESFSGVSTTAATLEAQVNPNNQETKYTFEYSTTEANKELTGAIVKVKGLSALEGFGDQLASVNLSGLEAAKMYFYRVTAENAKGEKAAPGTVESFTTATPPVLAAPAITENSVGVSGSSSPTEASFGAVINPNNQETTYEFEYSTEGIAGPAGTGTLTGTIEKVSGTESPLPAVLEERGVGSDSTGPVLEPGQVYYYRVSATNASGTTLGEVKLFSKAPEIQGQGYSAVTPISAKLEATLNPYFQPTSYFFEYSTTGTPGTGVPDSGTLTGTIKTATGTNTLPGVFEGLPASVEISGLKPGHAYFYRVVAENETTRTPKNKVGPSMGEVVEFHAAPAVSISGESASGLETSEATLSASIYPGDAITTYQVEYEPGKLTPLQELPASGEAVAVHVRVGGLRPDVTYHARFLAANDLGSAEGAVPSFTTPPDTSEEPSHGPAGPATPPTPSAPAGVPSLPVLSYPEAPTVAPGSTAPTIPTRTKVLTRAQRLAKALKACHTKKGKQRARCEVAARGRYGSQKKGRKGNVSDHRRVGS
jgi:phosphodiesterase/alkaline phosphatase D-like protein